MNPIYKRVLRLLLVGVGVYLWSRHDPKVPSTPPTTVPFVDVIKYAGTWYEIASIPMIFQRGCTNTRAIYSLKDDKTIEVNNRCYSNGKQYKVVGEAAPEDQTNAKLKVSFPVTLGITAPYWIVRLGKDYEYSVVSDSKYKYLWILSRKPHMSEFLYNELIEDLDKNGFPVNKLEKTLQDQPEEKLTEDKEEESL